MNDEQIAKKRKYAGERKDSMKRRDGHHNYSERRMYMITMEVEGATARFRQAGWRLFCPRG